ncbi:hypothetical protein QU481_10960 [Crenobacter sp. SG2303]|uniref:Uncharacterized protein n=1 Tax=Crenobacter oryzisoli TaxID=3056844 RepID=A0ABT7XNU8_9NEIS|nr:hypothetical protein [Crenobacter sp. SG2303]MDN0075410.1 hypothetical protein [Crenobacter sp. SG2303]
MLLELISLVWTAAVPMMDITLSFEESYPYHMAAEERETVTPVRLLRISWHKDEQCTYTGVMVPYVRDWEEVVHYSNHEEVRPPEPNKTEGQGIILTKKLCEGKAPESVFRVASTKVFTSNVTSSVL